MWIKGYFCCDHFLERMEEREITLQQIENALEFGEVLSQAENGRLKIGYRQHTLIIDPIRKILITSWTKKTYKKNKKKIQKILRDYDKKVKIPYKRERFNYKPLTQEQPNMNNGFKDLFNLKGKQNMTNGLVELSKTEKRTVYTITLRNWLEGFRNEIFAKNKLNRYSTGGSSENKVKNLFGPSNITMEALGTFVTRNVKDRSYIDVSGFEREDVRDVNLILLDGHTRTKRLLDLYKKDFFTEEQLDYEVVVISYTCTDKEAETIFRRINNGYPVSRADNSLSPGAPLGRLIKSLKLIPVKSREVLQLNFLEGTTFMMNEELELSTDPGSLYEETIKYGKKFNDLQKREANGYELEISDLDSEFLQEVQSNTNLMLDKCLYFVSESDPTIKKLVGDSVKNGGFQKLVQCFFATNTRGAKPETVARRLVSSMTKGLRKTIGQLNNQTRANREKAFSKVIVALHK